MAASFCLEKWNLEKVILDSISSYVKMRLLEKEWKWYNGNYLDSVSYIMLPEHDNHNKVEEVISNILNLDYILLADPKELYSSVDFLKQSEYSLRLIEELEEQKKELYFKLVEVRRELDLLNEKKLTAQCEPKLFIVLVLSAVDGIINKKDIELLKKINVPKNRKLNFDRFIEAIEKEDKAAMIEVLKLEEMKYQLY